MSDLEANARHTDSTAQAVTAAASERAEMLEAELTTVVGQRDEALEELSQLEDRLQQSQTSLASLQVVLEQMQRERDNQLRTAKVRVCSGRIVIMIIKMIIITTTIIGRF